MEGPEKINPKPFPGLFKVVNEDGTVIYRRKPEVDDFEPSKEVLVDYTIEKHPQDEYLKTEKVNESKDYPDYVLNYKTEKEQTESWLNEKQRKALNLLLVSLGVAMSAGAIKQGYEFVDKLESYSDMEKAGAEFDSEVESYAQSLDLADIIQTINLANEPEDQTKAESRLDTFINNIQFRSDEYEGRKPPLPAQLQVELKKLIPGWLAQESRFRLDAVSNSNATGIAQIKPFVWNGYRKTDQVSLDVAEQAEVFGELTSDNYFYLQHYAGNENLELIKERFDSEEEFLTEFMTPLMINAHNSGGPAAGRALKLFCEKIPVDKMKPGKDLFLQFSDFALKNANDYSKEQREYVIKILALQKMMERYSLEAKGGVQIASN